MLDIHVSSNFPTSCSYEHLIRPSIQASTCQISPQICNNVCCSQPVAAAFKGIPASATSWRTCGMLSDKALIDSAVVLCLIGCVSARHTRESAKIIGCVPTWDRKKAPNSELRFTVLILQLPLALFLKPPLIWCLLFCPVLPNFDTPSSQKLSEHALRLHAHYYFSSYHL